MILADEVTFELWDACIADGGCSHRPDDKGWGRAKQPVIYVSYNDITQQFIPWLNKVTREKFSLPTEAQWEYAARAGSTTAYSWGHVLVKTMQTVKLVVVHGIIKALHQ